MKAFAESQRQRSDLATSRLVLLGAYAGAMLASVDTDAKISMLVVYKRSMQLYGLYEADIETEVSDGIITTVYDSLKITVSVLKKGTVV